LERLQWQVVADGKPVYLAVSKSERERLPAKLAHRTHEFLTDVMQQNGDGRELEENQR